MLIYTLTKTSLKTKTTRLSYDNYTNQLLMCTFPIDVLQQSKNNSHVPPAVCVHCRVCIVILRE